MSATAAVPAQGQQNTTYVSRAINVTVQLGEGSFGNSGFDTAKLTGLRIAATIQKFGAPACGQAEIRVYGAPPSVLNQLNGIGVPFFMARNNIVTVEAGDAVNGMAVVYKGNIFNAYQNFDDAPDTFLQIMGSIGYYSAMAPVPPTSFPGTADVATIMSGFATQMGLSFENNGVTTKLSCPYFPGTLLEQAQACARNAGINMFRDDLVLAIWPKFGSRGGAIPLISAASGLIGYPRWSQYGMEFRCLFNPSIRLGGQIQMQSTLAAPVPAGQPATQQGGPNGTWVVTGLTYDLASQMPGGPWFCRVGCGFAPGGPAVLL